MEKIIIFGAGMECKNCIAAIKKELPQSKVIAIADNDSKKIGKVEIAGITVNSPEVVFLQEYDKVVVSTIVYFSEIYKTLRKYNVDAIYVLWKDKIVKALDYYTDSQLLRKEKRMFLCERIKSAKPLGQASVCETARIYASREEALKALPKNGICAEVGVAYGHFSEKIIDAMEPEHFYAIDYFSQDNPYRVCGYEEFCETDLTHEEFYYHKFKHKISNGEMTVRQGLSWEVLEEFEDDFFDYVYLDADHSYESVIKDIKVLKRKVKNGGIIQFNDYTSLFLGTDNFVGTIPAVNAFINSGHGEIIGFCFQIYGNYDLLVRIKKIR